MGKPFRQTVPGKLIRNAKVKWIRLQKWYYWNLFSGPPVERRTVFILGCQRSGTSMLGRVFEKDLRSTVLHEDSGITLDPPNRLRLRPYPEVNEVLGSLRTPLVVAKPLVESQNAIELLENVPGSKAIWMFRHYMDSSQSNVKRFKRQVRNIKAIIDEESDNWRSERVSADTHATLSRFYADDMSRLDAAALLWYARNQLFYELQLDCHPDVTMCQYEQLVIKPEESMRHLYRFLEMEYPRRRIIEITDTKSVARDRDGKCRDQIEKLCRDLQNRLEKSYQESIERLDSPVQVDSSRTQTQPSSPY